MNLNTLVNDYLEDGYSRDLAISRVCQDVILYKINNSNFNRNITTSILNFFTSLETVNVYNEY